MGKLVFTFGLQRLDADSRDEPGGLPQAAKEISTTSKLRGGGVQIVGTAHEAIAAGDVTDDAMAVLQNLSDAATIQVGIVQSATFYPLLSLAPGDPPAFLGRLVSIAGTYVKSSVADGELLVSLHKIVAA